ncbi:siderophore-interacting protein [Sphingomonas sp. H39-1-10]|uniref:siderophore-interacting protein n=1 Tax=Sphingomonas pollutisoli TaxID=3030829 RepID=UPI0023B9103F|nr:siderophore-interacting protein [Sphingomonas pollutisoli]MDF0491435.1 siderophore-interacting protein [Sphingomonas pollutisoli]
MESIERLTPRMLRIGFISPDLHDFVSASADDHIKLFFPENNAAEGGQPCMRDFTPRSFDTVHGRIVIDFALHDAGPATQWAAAARIGDTLEIGGPRGSAIIPDDFDWYLMIGDETALPAIGRRVEELRSQVPVVTMAVVASTQETQSFETQAAWTPIWTVRDGTADDAVLLRAVLKDWEPPAGEGFVWIAAESSVARAIRSYIVDERGHPREWTKAAGYWTRGLADAHERIGD